MHLIDRNIETHFAQRKLLIFQIFFVFQSPFFMQPKVSIMFKPDPHPVVYLAKDILNVEAKSRRNCGNRLLALWCLSICSHATARLQPDRFHWNLIFKTHIKFCKNFPNLVLDKDNRSFRWRRMYIHGILKSLFCTPECSLCGRCWCRINRCI